MASQALIPVQQKPCNIHGEAIITHNYIPVEYVCIHETFLRRQSQNLQKPDKTDISYRIAEAVADASAAVETITINTAAKYSTHIKDNFYMMRLYKFSHNTNSTHTHTYNIINICVKNTLFTFF